MILAFKVAAEAAKIETGAAKVFSLGISRVTHGLHSHVEIGLTQNSDKTWKCFASREPDGTSFQDIDLSNTNLWTIEVIPTITEQELRILDWCLGCELRPYNMLAILGLLIDRGWTEPHDMICSQCAAKMLQDIFGWFKSIPPWCIAPDGFEKDPKRYGLLELVRKQLGASS